VRVALRIAVAPWGGGDGPHVRCERPLEIEVPERGVTALVGGNGSGKSVLLSVLAGLLDLPQVVAAGPPQVLAPILAAQYPELQIFEERVADEVVFAAVSRGTQQAEALARAAGLFERLGLPSGPFLQRRCWSLAAGEKRLLQAAGALIAPASLVLLDEPTAGLDPARRLALAAIVRERAASGPVVIASQDEAWLARVGAHIQPLEDEPAAAPKPQRKNGLTEACPRV